MHIQNIQTSVVDSMSYLNVVADNLCKLTLKIFDNKGFIAKTISTQVEKGAHLLDLNDLSDGTYIINAFSEDTFFKAFKFTKI